MNRENMNMGQEGFGVYGWDTTNPYLQELYKKERQQEPDNWVEKLPSQKFEWPNQQLPFGKSVPAQPFQQEEIEIPYKSNRPVNPTPRSSTPPTESPQRTIRSFTEGMELAGKRFLNDMKYSRGYIGDKFSRDKSEESKEALKHLPEYDRSSDAELEAQRDSLEREVEREPSPATKNELRGLKDYQRMRQKGMSQEEIKKELSDLAEWGTWGRKEMEEAVDINNSFPIAEGAAIGGDIATGIGRTILPVLAGVASLPAGMVLGAGTVLSSVAESHAQAQMELDNYERIIGKPLPKLERLGFTSISVGADFIISSILQSRYLGNLKSGIKKKISQQFKKQVLKNKVAQSEVKNLLHRLERIESAKIGEKIGDEFTLGMFSEGLTALAHDAASTIYLNKQDYPTLNDMLENITKSMVVGGVTGGIAGGIGQAVNHHAKQKRRYEQEDIPLINTHQGMLEVIDYDTNTKIVETINPDGYGTTQWFPAFKEDIKLIPYKEYLENQRNLKLIDEPDPLLRIDKDPDKDQAWAAMSPLGQRRMVLDLASRMGLDNVEVYHHVGDLPRSAFMSTTLNAPEGSYYLHNGYVAIVLDKVKNYNHLHYLLLYEAVAQQGLWSLFNGIPQLYHSFLRGVYESMPESSKIHGDSFAAKELDACTYLTDLAASGINSNALQKYINELKEPISLLNPEIYLTDKDIRVLLTRARDELKKDYTWVEGWRHRMKLVPRPFGNSDYPLTELKESTIKYFQENDPVLKKYKRFYDEVYGQDDATDTPDLPEQE